MCSAGAVMMIGPVFSAYGSIQKGKQTADEKYEEARMNRALSKEAKVEGYIQEEQYRKKIDALEGSQNVAMGSSGLDISSGSFAKTSLDTAEIEAKDINTIRRNALLKAWGYDVKTQKALYESDKAQYEGFSGAFGTLLGAGGKAAAL